MKTIIIENTPTNLCDECCEQYYEEDVIKEIEKVIENINTLPIKLVVLDFKDLSK